ncbi:MAG TPA: tyrosine-type recombinase/integrase [Allosphingosinicella sp.]|nr:tyrosine-type recombinase/integrase [Allosphingosinicella sp.]
MRRAGIARHVRLHDLRHTYASLLIAPKYIQVQMGHASIQTTLDRYGHLMPDLHRAEASKLASTYIAGMSVIEELGSPFAAKIRSSLLVGLGTRLEGRRPTLPAAPIGP